MLEMPIGNGEAILLVEDDQAIMEIVREMLEELRYRVLVAGTPGDAIRMTETIVKDIHLLVTDVMMPEMNGRDLSARIRALKPGIKCLLISGYTSKDITRQGVLLDPGTHFIQKPFSIKELAAKVRDVLDDDKWSS